MPSRLFHHLDFLKQNLNEDEQTWSWGSSAEKVDAVLRFRNGLRNRLETVTKRVWVKTWTGIY